MGFSVCAPGKVILFGEHAVVHGVPAIAASVALHTYLCVEELADNVVELDFPDVGLEVAWTTDEFDEILGRASGDVLDALDLELHALAVQVTDKAVGADRFARAACVAFLYLYMSVGVPNVRGGHRFVVRSALPLGAGLGSSASLTVCLAAGLLRLAGRIDAATPREEALELVTKWSFLGECCIHGKPSGIDNVVAARGGAVHFQRRADGPPAIKPYNSFPGLRLILTDTGVPRLTAELVARVNATKERWPLVFQPLMAAVDEIVREADVLLSSGVAGPELVSRISELVELNHGVLVALSVSHPTLEKVREAGALLGIGSTKLTGAGGGGCAITIASAPGPIDGIDLFRQHLGPRFKVFETKLGGQGVGFCDETASDLYDLQRLPWSYWTE